MMTMSVASLAERLARIPKFVLFGAAALVQVALLALMIIDRAQILRDGTEVTLQTRPVDPRDFLRGDYVVMGYDIAQLPAGSLQNQPSGQRNPLVYVKLAPNRDGVYQALSVHAGPVAVASPEVLIRGRLAYGASCGSKHDVFCQTLRFATISRAISFPRVRAGSWKIFGTRASSRLSRQSFRQGAPPSSAC